MSEVRVLQVPECMTLILTDLDARVDAALDAVVEAEVWDGASMVIGTLFTALIRRLHSDNPELMARLHRALDASMDQVRSEMN